MIPAAVCAALLFAISALGLWLDRGRRGGPLELLALLPLVPLITLVTGAWTPTPITAALVAGLVIATLSRARDDVLNSECALKLLWVLGPALALSIAGVALLAVTTATSLVPEQWGVLAMQLEPRLLWATSLSLSLLCGFVLLGGAPFHFWAADVTQGARPWVSGLAVSALQACGAAWLQWRLAGVSTLPDAARGAETLLGVGAGFAFAAGAITLPFQRRPERRVGTLASLNGALVLAYLAVRCSTTRSTTGPIAMLGIGSPPILPWSAHEALALAGAATLAPFLPVRARGPSPAPVLFRRNPVWGLLGLYSMASLAGVPGTPGAVLWLAVARALVASSRTGLLLLLALAWVSAFTIVIRQARDAFGIRTESPLPPRGVPLPARWAMLAGATGLVMLMIALRT